MTQPKLSVAASGHGGRGYRDPFTGATVIGVTTALGAVNKPALIDWAVSQTAAYAVANLDLLYQKSEESGFKMLRWYQSRAKPADFDDPDIDINNYHKGVLNDAAELGTMVHEWVEADLTGGFEPEITRREQEEMVEQYLLWKMDNDIEVHATEATVFGTDYGGTADLFATVNGVKLCLDVKTARNTWNEHFAQLAALGAATTMAREVTKGTEGAVKHKSTRDGESWWVADVPPAFTDYAILHIRPDDYNAKGEFVPAFCKLKPVSHERIDAGWKMFQAAKALRFAEYEFKQIEKKEGR